MPKTPSVILKKMLEDRQIELLDIYHYRDRDIIRVKDKLSGRVDIYVSRIHVRDLADKAELEKLASEIEAKLRG